MSTQTQENTVNKMGMIFNIQDFSVQDGPGIRTTVFLKGCPLRCRWCANPEGQVFHPELMHSRSLCKQCQRCFSLCPNGAISIDREGYPDFQREICRFCQSRECEKACIARAIKFAGELWLVEDLFQKIKTNSLFYRNSEGGVTFSGGEPFAQPEFVREFLSKSEAIGLSVGIETCGFFNWDQVEDFIDKFDFYYFDFKCHDPKLHKKVTGQTNKVILENLRRLAEVASAKIIISIPVIPGVNDSEEMMCYVAGLCKKLNISKIRLLPYHTMGAEKYRELGREYTMEKDLEINPKDLQKFQRLISTQGVDCWIE
ncbi:hypothetical protein BBF96_06490 [Anoxybacter fermentans]|uniref:Glycyl-radical enzyme activating protein n=1 Tax=Anoxybacter fermentans TaxID=1323375 RepID=A0A3Q9HPX6_9FIRM|nr:glycyl-radical enzyme activating protein [Anoxybacter fermentans]AZR73063.1 hypothetical protein BBF96_06490 [Anoxybacter fermentans]